MVRSRKVNGKTPARTEGARRATGVRAGDATAGAGSLEPGQRWSAGRKRDVVLRVLRPRKNWLFSWINSASIYLTNLLRYSIIASVH